MRNVLLLSFSVLLVLSGVVHAANFDACVEAEETTSSITRDHQDLGGGLVTYVRRGFGLGIVTDTRSIESCATGDTIHALHRVEQVYELSVVNWRLFDVSDEFSSVWTNAVESDEKVTFEMLGQRLSAIGAEVNRSTSEWESCACHLAYPRLRGSKEKFDRIR